MSDDNDMIRCGDAYACVMNNLSNSDALDAIDAIPAAPAEDVRAGALKEATDLIPYCGQCGAKETILALITDAKP